MLDEWALIVDHPSYCCRSGYRISIKGALITVTSAKILKPHPLFVKPRPFGAYSRRKGVLRASQKRSVYARKLPKGKLQQESFSTWLEKGLDFVHIHYFPNRVLAKRGGLELAPRAPGSATAVACILLKITSDDIYMHGLSFISCLPCCHDESSVCCADLITGTNWSSTENSRIGLKGRS